jgi:signal transduction histidine kinase
MDWPTAITEQTDLYRRNDPSRTFTVTVDPAVAQVVADPNLATGILANLLSNALKYSPEGSPIVVTATVDGDRVITTVIDEGPGVPPGDRERIFDKFTRLGDHLTRPQQGVGLGLFIARRSLDEMGGEIWCDERPGGGARFGFSLPAHQPAPAGDAAASPSALRA